MLLPANHTPVDLGASADLSTQRSFDLNIDMRREPLKQ